MLIIDHSYESDADSTIFKAKFPAITAFVVVLIDPVTPAKADAKPPLTNYLGNEVSNLALGSIVLPY